MMQFDVKSSKDAADALSYFNRFHDSFVESITLNVMPEGPEGFGYGVPVHYSAVIVFVHGNYPATGKHASHQHRIEVRLVRVNSFQIGDVVPLDNMLQECLIEVSNGTVHLDVGGDGMVTFDCDYLVVQDRGPMARTEETGENPGDEEAGEADQG